MKEALKTLIIAVTAATVTAWIIKKHEIVIIKDGKKYRISGGIYLNDNLISGYGVMI